MPTKYPICTPAEVHGALKRAGFWDVKQTGSHAKMTDGVHIVIVPMHNKDLKVGTLKGILEQAGMSVEVFRNHL